VLKNSTANPTSNKPLRVTSAFDSGLGCGGGRSAGDIAHDQPTEAEHYDQEAIVNKDAIMLKTMLKTISRLMP
jgi:hypothetical protein